MSTPRRRRTRSSETLGNPIVVGSIILLAAAIGVILSYSANRGLPFVPTYEIVAEVPDAAELIEGSSEVRIGGARVGIVKEIKAIPAKDSPTGRSVARLRLALDKEQETLPDDSTVQVRPRSILGAKYVDLVRGTRGRPLAAGATLPVRQAKPIVELDEAFNVFDDDTSRGIQNSVTVLGNALAGRGGALNEILANASRTMIPLTAVMRTLADPQTELRGFVDGAAAASAALEPVAPQLGRMLDSASVTLEAVDAGGVALERTISDLPETEVEATAALREITPVLRDVAIIGRVLRPGARRLPTVSRRLAAALDAGTPVLRGATTLARDLRGTLAALDVVARDPATDGAVRKLIATVTSLGRSLDVLGPAQTQCNVSGLFVRNLQSTASDGDADGAFITLGLVVGLDEAEQSDRPIPALASNPQPHANAAECESGNETYRPGQLGNPAGDQPNTTELTAPPAAATARARRAGLLTGADR